MTTLEQDVISAENAIFDAIERPTAEQIKSLRTWLGLTQSAFAKKAGVTLSQVQKWESGMHSPRPHVWKLLKITLYITS